MMGQCEDVSIITKCAGFGRNEDKEPPATLFGYQTIEKINPKELEFPRSIILGEGKCWAPMQLKVSLFCRKRIHILLTACQTSLQERLEDRQHWGARLHLIKTLFMHMLFTLFYMHGCFVWIGLWSQKRALDLLVLKLHIVLGYHVDARK